MKHIKSIPSELVLSVILLLGLFLRIYHLGKESIWIDETYSIQLADLSFLKIAAETSQDVHTPLYYIILHYWVILFGNSEFSIRFPSVVFGLLAIFMIYKVGSLLFDKEVGILSSLVLALSVFHIHYSQDARMYSLMTLLTLLSFYFFIELLRKRNLLVLIGYILSSALLIYTHYFGIFIIIAQNIYVLTRFLLSEDADKRDFKKWISLQVVLVLLLTPWIVVLVKQILRVRGGYWIPEPSVETLAKSFRLYSGPYLILLFAVLSFFAAVNYERVRGNLDWKRFFKSIETYRWNVSLSDVGKTYLLLVWLLTPVILLFVISKVSTPIYWDRYTIGASLAFYLLVTRGICNINYKYVKLAVIGIIVIVSLVNVWEYYTTINKEKWNDVASYIDANAESEDLILFNAGTSQLRGILQSSFDYYSERTNLIKKPFPKEHNDVDEEDIRQLKPIAEDYNKVWVILAYTSDNNKELIKKNLIELYDSFHHKNFVSYTYATGDYPTIDVYIFEKN
jgi:Predicted membrane protein